MKTEDARDVVRVVLHGELLGADDYARDKIGSLFHLAHEPVLYARVKLTKHHDPAVSRPVVAQAKLDVNGRLVRAQVAGPSAREAIDQLEARLRRRLERIARHWGDGVAGCRRLSRTSGGMARRLLADARR